MESTIARLAIAWLKITGHNEYRTNDCFLLVSVNEYGVPSFAKVIDIYLISDNFLSSSLFDTVLLSLLPFLCP